MLHQKEWENKNFNFPITDWFNKDEFSDTNIDMENDIILTEKKFNNFADNEDFVEETLMEVDNSNELDSVQNSYGSFSK